MARRRARKVNCVVLSCLAKPGVIWRFFRRQYFHRLHKQIKRLPQRGCPDPLKEKLSMGLPQRGCPDPLKEKLSMGLPQVAKKLGTS